MKISVNNSGNLFATSDFHLNHGNILNYESSQSFQNVTEMNESLIERFNKRFLKRYYNPFLEVLFW